MTAFHGQPEEPAPEGNTPRLVARRRLQGLDEDQLRQVLRVRRAMDTADDVAVDRRVVVIEQSTKRPRIPSLGVPHESLDSGVVECHNERTPAALGWRSSGTDSGAPPRRMLRRQSPRSERGRSRRRDPTRRRPRGAHPNPPSRARRRARGSGHDRGDGYVSPATWRRPLVFTSRAVPVSISAQDRLVELRRSRQLRRRHVGMQIPLHEVGGRARRTGRNVPQPRPRRSRAQR